MRIEKLKTLRIDVEKGIYEVNGKDVSQSGKYLNLTFEEGVWSLVVSEDTAYTINDQAILKGSTFRRRYARRREYSPGNLVEIPYRSEGI